MEIKFFLRIEQNKKTSEFFFREMFYAKSNEEIVDITGVLRPKVYVEGYVDNEMIVAHRKQYEEFLDKKLAQKEYLQSLLNDAQKGLSEAPEFIYLDVVKHELKEPVVETQEELVSEEVAEPVVETQEEPTSLLGKFKKGAKK